ncbi:MAG: hypothetical protein DWQ37_13320 [Planctomycetota bacterium]|nr:MAG: hypothetical protein DWQ37_13320 [Planctomycetota bacterium]
MVCSKLRATLAVAALACLFGLVGSTTAEASHPDIFNNYYNGPTIYGQGTPAQLYISPRPTPPLVGHTWITYPPLNPHEFMYHHHRKYYKYYRNGGFTTSCVRYYTW